jgi:hypothetical protein
MFLLLIVPGLSRAVLLPPEELLELSSEELLKVSPAE